MNLSAMPLKSALRRALVAVAAASCLTGSWATIALAQGALPGLTIFSGVDREYELGFRLDNGGRINRFDRYHLRIPAEKLETAGGMFVVTYPDTYEGEIDPEDIEIRVGGDSVPLEEVTWNEQDRFVELIPLEPIPALSRVEIVFSNVRNPRRTGTHYFNALVRAPGDVIPPQYVGTWILSFGRQSRD